MTQRNNLQTADLPHRANAFAAASSGQSAFVNSVETASARVAAPPCRTRRAARIAVSLPITVRDQFGGQEETRTQFVMLRGAVIATTSNVRAGHRISIRNIRNGKTAECHVIGVEPIVKDVHQVEVEFTAPQPGFWPIQFPAEESFKGDSSHAGAVNESKSQPVKTSLDMRPSANESRPFDDFKADPLLEVHRLDASCGCSETSLSEVTNSHDDIVVLAGPLTEAFTSPRSTGARTTLHSQAVDSVAHFRAANRAAHRRERRMKVVYSILSIAAIAFIVMGSKIWMPARANATSPTNAMGLVTKPAVSAPEVETQPLTTSSASTQLPAAETDNTSGGAPLAVSNGTPATDVPWVETVVKPAETETVRPVETQVEVRHGVSAASLRKTTEEVEEEPIAFPLRVAGDSNSQSKPEMLSAVAQTPVKTAVLAPQPPKRAIPAKLLRSIPAQYPAVARQMRLEGDVILSLQIDPSGAVTGAKVIYGSPVLSAAALDSVRRWKYQPATLGEKAVASSQEVKLSFSLK